MRLRSSGQIEKTSDRDYEVEERWAIQLKHIHNSANHTARRFRAMEAAANKLQKEAKGYLDALRGSHS